MRLAAIIAMSLGLVGCCCFMFQGDPYYGEYTREKPDEKDIVGVWVANARSAEWLKGKGYAVAASPALELRADGTFTMEHMPDCWRVFFDREREGLLESGAGTWQIGRHQEWWVVELTFDRPPWFSGGSYSTRFHLRRQTPPYLLHIIVGDPDAGDGIVMERQ